VKGPVGRKYGFWRITDENEKKTIKTIDRLRFIGFHEYFGQDNRINKIDNIQIFYREAHEETMKPESPGFEVGLL